MNAYGIASNVSAATSTAGTSTGAAAGKAGTAGGFAGVLVQAMDGSGSSSASATGNGVPAGLMGLLGLLGAQMGESASPELMNLLNGLTEQLNNLDPNKELPAELQDQLASLLLLIQNLLIPTSANPESTGDSVTAMLSSPNAGTTETPKASNAPINLVTALRQSLQQLADRWTQGETLADSAPQLETALKKTLDAVRQWTAAKVPDDQTDGTVSKVTKTADQTAIPAAGEKASAVSQSAEGAVIVQTEVRKTVSPLRNPAWQFHAAAGSEASLQTVEGTAPAAAVESADTSGQNGSAPAWTFLKGDNALMPTSVSTNTSAPAQVPVQQFAEQMGKFLVKQFVLTQGHGTTEAKISLHPEHLGQVDIKIMIQNGLLTAQFVTENGVAKDALENQMSQLRTALQGQGLQVDKMEVVQQSASADTASFFQQHHGQSGSGHQGGNSKSRGSKGVYDDPAGFEAELDRTSFLREIGFGSSLNVTA